MVKQYVLFGFFLLVTSLLTGCGMKGYLRVNAPVEDVYDKNYEIDQQMTAYTGQPIIKAKQFRAKKFESYTSGTDFRIKGGFVDLTGRNGELLAKYAEAVVENVTYSIVEVYRTGSTTASLGVLVAPDGSVYNQVDNHGTLVVIDVDVSPPDLKIVPTNKPKYILSEQTEQKGSLNYELIYGGTEGDSFKINYREYTSENLARTPFFQDLTYPKSSEEFRFKNYRVKIHEVESGKIVYSVIEDGL